MRAALKNAALFVFVGESLVPALFIMYDICLLQKRTIKKKNTFSIRMRN